MENISHLSRDNAQDVAYTYKIFYVFNKNNVHETAEKYFVIFMKTVFELESFFTPVLKVVTNLRSKIVLTDIYSRKSC